MQHRNLIVYPNQTIFAQAVAARTLLLLNQILSSPDRERVDIAVTGGSDGTAILTAIAQSPLQDIVDWSKVHVWWGDERFVPAASDERNEQAARKALLDKLIRDNNMKEDHIHPMPADTRSFEERQQATAEDNQHVLEYAAQQYQEELLHNLGEQAAMDLMMFGVGPDGHFASLFPNASQLDMQSQDILVTGVIDSPKQPPLRLTMTIPMICRSAYVWMCGSRAGKADAMKHTFTQVRDKGYPGSFADATQEVLWICDQDSAAHIK